MTTPKMNGQSANTQDELLQLIQEQFPEVFSEGKVDSEKLKQTLGEKVEVGAERYGLSWSGKSNCFREIQKTTSATLEPVPEESVNFDSTKNLFIEGDNLEVLRVLQRSYYGKVKMIYIDPPYNTGNDFIYNDNFKQDKTTYQAESGQRNGSGDLLKDNVLRRNSKDNGHYHSDWLSMMYPRLFLARNLLRHDGVIFVSIDDNEVANLRLIMDEVFGEENFVAQFIWEKRVTRENRRTISVRHDYVIAYLKDKNLIEDSLGLMPMDEAAMGRYSNPDNDSRGDWTSAPATAQAGHGTKSQFYSFITPGGREVSPPPGRCWLYTQPRMEEEITKNNIWFGRDGNGVPRIKKFLNIGRQGLTPETIWWAKDVGTNDSAKRSLLELFEGKAVFDTPKPTELIKRMIEIATKPGDIILDFFAGSGTTAEAVINSNLEEKGSRKWICIQIPETISEDSDAHKYGYKNIAQVAKKRIELVGEKIKNKNDKTLFAESELDLGFKSFRLKESNFSQWESSVKTYEELSEQLELSINNIKPNSQKNSILYELILKSGLELTMPIEKQEIDGVTFFKVNDNKLIVCLEGTVSREFVDYLEKTKPSKVIFLEKVFAGNDDLKTNSILNLERADIDFRVV